MVPDLVRQRISMDPQVSRGKAPVASAPVESCLDVASFELSQRLLQLDPIEDQIVHHRLQPAVHGSSCLELGGSSIPRAESLDSLCRDRRCRS